MEATWYVSFQVLRSTCALAKTNFCSFTWTDRYHQSYLFSAIPQQVTAKYVFAWPHILCMCPFIFLSDLVTTNIQYFVAKDPDTPLVKVGFSLLFYLVKVWVYLLQPGEHTREEQASQKDGDSMDSLLDMNLYPVILNRRQNSGVSLLRNGCNWKMVLTMSLVTLKSFI